METVVIQKWRDMTICRVAQKQLDFRGLGSSVFTIYPYVSDPVCLVHPIITHSASFGYDLKDYKAECHRIPLPSCGLGQLRTYHGCGG